MEPGSSPSSRDLICERSIPGRKGKSTQISNIVPPLIKTSTSSSSRTLFVQHKSILNILSLLISISGISTGLDERASVLFCSTTLRITRLRTLAASPLIIGCLRSIDVLLTIKMENRTNCSSYRHFRFAGASSRRPYKSAGRLGCLNKNVFGVTIGAKMDGGSSP